LAAARTPTGRTDGKLGASDAELAHAAFEAGSTAASSGDRASAIAWLDRACRLLPHDRTYTLTLATHCLGTDDARAASLFAKVLETNDVREAWFGLAHARLRLGMAELAAAALHEALSRHAMLPGCDGLARQIVAALGAFGWCGLATGDRLLVGAGAASAKAELILDGASLKAVSVPAPGIALPKLAASCRFLSVRIDGRDVLGSPIALAAIRRTEGFVACRDGGLEGWVWHPADPDREPVVQLVAASGQSRTIAAMPGWHDVAGSRVLARPRRLTVPASRLAGLRGPFALTGVDGTALLGSPLDPRAEADAARDAALALAERFPAAASSARRKRATITAVSPGAIQADVIGPYPPVGLVRRRRPVAVVLPVYAGFADTMACLEGVFRDAGRGVRVVVVDDATPEPALAEALDRLAALRRIVLIRHAVNRGFPASANAGLRACPGRDVVLLNSDIILPEGWLDRLRAAAYAAPDIGSVTPLSNDASIVSYPGPPETNAVPDEAEARHLDTLTQRANGTATVDIPVGVGFCLYLRRDCLDAVGLFREDAFAQGYGEEVDFCLRARHLGWRHVAATGVFVAHVGGRSFGSARRFLLARNQDVLNRLHPGFDRLIAVWAAEGGLAAARRRLDEARWRAAKPRGRAAGRSVLLITHAAGGGVERRLAARCAALTAEGVRPVVLRPATTSDGGPAVLAGTADSDDYPNLIYAMPSELPLFAAWLRGQRPSHVEVHHLLGHNPAVLELLRRLGLSYDVAVHDYAWFCPRVALVGPQHRYCGEPDPAACEACVADAGRLIDEDIPVQALIDRSARLLGAARRVVAPSHDAAARMRRHFPALRPDAEPHEDDDAILLADPLPISPSLPCRVVTVGAIGVEKGFDVLLDCARDAAARSLPLEFVVVGHTIDDARLIGTGRIFVTGEFAAGEAAALIRAQRPSLGLLPSVWPETWCFALSDLWRAGLHVAAFDLGAQAERIRASGGRGVLLPLGLPTPAINNALLAAAGLRGHQ
jgi:GT2 family glycosyltransferase/glycosyltransferase involved in cell wall biosynthesis